jgi:hypothetical protein
LPSRDITLSEHDPDEREVDSMTAGRLILAYAIVGLVVLVAILLVTPPPPILYAP